MSEPTEAPKVPTLADTVKVWEGVVDFLSELAQQLAPVPNSPAEIVKSAVGLAVFLRNRADAVRKQFPDQFPVEKPAEVPTNPPDLKLVPPLDHVDPVSPTDG